jgi:hypothetical protein
MEAPAPAPAGLLAAHAVNEMHWWALWLSRFAGVGFAEYATVPVAFSAFGLVMRAVRWGRGGPLGYTGTRAKQA